MENGKRCPVCGERVIGRSDKIYCSDSCRVYAANKRGQDARKGRQGGETIKCIYGDLLFLDGKWGGRYLKFIAFVTHICKIISKFGR